MKRSVAIILLLIIFLIPGEVFSKVQGEPEILEAEIIRVVEEKEGKSGLYQKLELFVRKGSKRGEKIIVENGNIPAANTPKFKAGDGVVLNLSKNIDGNDFVYITDYIRRDSLLWLFIIFAVLAVIIGRWRGLTSLIAMGISFGVIFVFILPQILSGADPIFISVLGSFVIIPVTFYLSHGLNRKTTLAILGTVTALILTGILANVYVEVSKLSGFASEEASFLQIEKEGAVNIKGLLLAGIIIGVLGLLDDITVSQAAVVKQLKDANRALGAGELYKRAMDVGRDHIASMVNTLVLVYAGAAMPLLLLFINNPHPFSEVINYEIVATEIVRTLVGSIGLILAVPITTGIAALASKRSAEKPS